jgi:redox-sensitive bicupin YhaK (pirin superfamily)
MRRTVTKKVQGFRTVDGGGVSLVRVLGNATVRDFDPFLMLDSFDSDNPDDYTAGFPMHPHRGIETISYLAKGKMQHRDSLGHEDTVGDGEVQYMTAGSGILHEERVPAAPRMLGLQLWLNLPAAEKMAKPAYSAVKRDTLPEVRFEGGSLRVLMGSYGETHGKKSRHLPFDYYAVHLDGGASLTIETDAGRSCMIFTLEGSVRVEGETVGPKTAAKLSEGDSVTIAAEGGPAEVMFMSSVALGEPVYWGGPVVMASHSDLWTAFRELDEGTFIKEQLDYGSEDR